ncbi:hypothetical protein K443DRAFT_602366 [Laccaria amethystina LaAM-08-1]|uniref:Uncharacterized protein n=1 Tax=Laccaria amethystina LaAM-08-1 TaxID=1095629 RepID=A0A0C9WKX3_9AGAR|nr:hypothetical protein K443DRAFT_602366 [Laccaria amethystina LaAM-08-1]
MKRFYNRSPLNVQSSQGVEEDKMESLQTVSIELLGPSLQPSRGWSVPEGFMLADCKIPASSMYSNDESRPIPKRLSKFPLSSLPSRSDSEPNFGSLRFTRQPETLFISGNEISEADKLYRSRLPLHLPLNLTLILVAREHFRRTVFHPQFGARFPLTWAFICLGLSVKPWRIEDR